MLAHTGKNFIATSENNCIGAVVIVKLLECIIQLNEQCSGEGIEGSWTVKGDW